MCPTLQVQTARCPSKVKNKPQDGALPKPPRSRFRADGRRRRTSGELKKRAPYVQYWKDIQAKQREREREREDEKASSFPPRPSTTLAPPASKRSRSTQVSDEFVRRQQEAESPQAAPTEDLCATQIQRLHRVVELLEQLAQAGLPTLLSTFKRSGDFTKHHNRFHGHPSTAEFPRVGNWNLSLTGSLLCPHLRGIYNNVEAFGSFMESFSVQRQEAAPPRLVRQILAPRAADCLDDGHLHTGDLRCHEMEDEPGRVHTCDPHP